MSYDFCIKQFLLMRRLLRGKYWDGGFFQGGLHENQFVIYTTGVIDITYERQCVVNSVNI